MTQFDFLFLNHDGQRSDFYSSGKHIDASVPASVNDHQNERHEHLTRTAERQPDRPTDTTERLMYNTSTCSTLTPPPPPPPPSLSPCQDNVHFKRMFAAASPIASVHRSLGRSVTNSCQLLPALLESPFTRFSPDRCGAPFFVDERKEKSGDALSPIG